MHILSEMNPDTLMAMSNLVMVLLDPRQGEHARRMMHKVHASREERVGNEHPYTL